MSSPSPGGSETVTFDLADLNNRYFRTRRGERIAGLATFGGLALILIVLFAWRWQSAITAISQASLLGIAWIVEVAAFAVSISLEVSLFVIASPNLSTIRSSADALILEFRGGMGEHGRALLSRTNAYIFVPGPALAGSPRLSREELTSSTAYNSSWYEAAKKARLRGVRMLFGYVGDDGARMLHRPLDRIVREQLNACLTDFRRVRRTGLALPRLLRPHSKVEVRAEGEELSFEIGGEDALDDGVVDRRDLAAGGNMVNMPPGYYAREILQPSLTGAVRLYAPVPRIGKVADLRFEFDHGRLTKWQSETDQRWLNAVVKSTPKDRRTFGAVAVGLNPRLHRGFGQDRLVEGAVTFMGMFQGTARAATLDVNGNPVISEGKLV